MNSYMPSPEQIAEECRKIQAGWTTQEELDRRGIRRGEVYFCPQDGLPLTYTIPGSVRHASKRTPTAMDIA